MKSLGVKPYLFPMPTYMIGTYDEEGNVDEMMMAWGGICAEDMVALNLEESHKTVENLRRTGAFTLAVPSAATLKESDYFGIATANKTKDKFARTGLHAFKSSRVNAPVVEEYPLTLECTVVALEEEPYGLRVLGKIENVLAAEDILTEDGDVDIEKLDPFLFDQARYGYYALGKKIGTAWKSGKEFLKR